MPPACRPPSPWPRGAPRVSAWLLSGDSYSKHWGCCLSSGPGLHQFVQFMLGRGSKTGAYRNSGCIPSRQGDPRVPSPARGGWWGPPQQELWGLLGAALALSPQGTEQLGWGGHVWTLQGGGGRAKSPWRDWERIFGLHIAADGMSSHLLLLLKRCWEGANAKSE